MSSLQRASLVLQPNTRTTSVQIVKLRAFLSNVWRRRNQENTNMTTFIQQTSEYCSTAVIWSNVNQSALLFMIHSGSELTIIDEKSLKFIGSPNLKCSFCREHSFDRSGLCHFTGQFEATLAFMVISQNKRCSSKEGSCNIFGLFACEALNTPWRHIQDGQF